MNINKVKTAFKVADILSRNDSNAKYIIKMFWHEEKNGDFVNKPIVRRSLKKIFDFAKNIENQSEGWLSYINLLEDAFHCKEKKNLFLCQYHQMQLLLLSLHAQTLSP